VLLPILLLAGCGAVLQRKFGLHMPTLVKLNLYLFVPAFLFHRIVISDIRLGEAAVVVGATCVVALGLGVVAGVVAKVAGASRGTIAAVAMATCVYNSGNYGVPLAELAFGAERAAVQTIVLATQNVLTFTVGLLLAAGGSGFSTKEAALKLAKLPIPYALAAAVVGRWVGPEGLPGWLLDATRLMADGLVPIALVTLGAQLATTPRWPRWGPVGLVAFLRLVVGPAAMAGLLWLGHRLSPGTAIDLWPRPAEVLILTAGVPTAVNTLLLTLELDGDAKLAADCVFWTTVLSAPTVAIWLLVLA
jgi:predicted permease